MKTMFTEYELNLIVLFVSGANTPETDPDLKRLLDRVDDDQRQLFEDARKERVALVN